MSPKELQSAEFKSRILPNNKFICFAAENAVYLVSKQKNANKIVLATRMCSNMKCICDRYILRPKSLTNQYIS